MDIKLKLIELLKSYSDGDLVALVEIREMAGALKDEYAELSEEILKLVDKILSGSIPESAEGEMKRYGALLESVSTGMMLTSEKKKENDSESDEESKIQIEDKEILFSFLQEAREHLEAIEEKILQAEKNQDPVLIHEIFRSMHTIKGVSGFIGLKQIKNISHLMETLLDLLRNTPELIDEEVIDLLLNGSDRLNQLIEELEKESQKYAADKKQFSLHLGKIKTKDITEKIDIFIRKLEDLEEADSSITIETVSENEDMSIVSREIKKETAKKPVLLWDDQGNRKDKQTVFEEFPEDMITQEMVQKFVEESSDLIDTTEHSILGLEKNPDRLEAIEESFRNIHTIKGNAGFFWFGIIENVCMGLESVLDALRKKEQRVTGKIVNVILESLDSLRVSLQRVASGEIRPGTLASAESAESGTRTKSKGAEDEEESEAFGPLGDLLVEMGVATQEQVEKALDLQQMKLGEILISQGSVKQEDIEAALQKQEVARGEQIDQFSSYRVKRKDIRVDTNRLDKLFDLMGELITAEAMVVNNPDLEGYELPNFDRSVSYLSKISRELQEITMTIRMIPLDGLFNKMRRLVRDLAKKFDKEINLKISGEETEMDRNVMEEISDPLVHIIRNSIDHGIEPTEIRLENKKNPAGTVELNAKYEGNEIWITISDDGAGLNKDRILSKAVERGLINLENKDMPDNDIWKLVFEPGFSTAAQVSEISGRGVGMDVVKKNIEKLHGKIDIFSRQGQGSSIVLKIPLTLAIIEGISFRVSRQIYSLPINDIIQFYKAKRADITRTDSKEEVLNLRNELIPIIKLHHFFKISSDPCNAEDGIIIVVQSMGRKVAFLVDEIFGYRQLVIKPLPSYMGNLRAISGCSILSDGKVSLIIDAGALISDQLE